MLWTRTGWGVAIILTLAWASPAVLADEDAPLGERLVDVMNQLFGQHPGLRANHAKGVVVEGSFTPSGAGADAEQGPAFPGCPHPGHRALLGRHRPPRDPGR